MHVSGWERSHQSVPAADIFKPEPHQRHKSCHYQEELDHFVVNCAGESSEKNVDKDDESCEHNTDMENPVKWNTHKSEGSVQDVETLNQSRHCIHRNPGREHGHDGERNRIQSARLFVKTQTQILGNRP